MSRLSERDIARKLAEREDLEPPAGLLDKIKSEIPPTVSLGTGAPGLERRSAMPTTQRWLIAASLIAAVGAGVFALRMQREAPSMADMAVEEAPAAAPQRESRAAAPEAAPESAPEPVPVPESEPALQQAVANEQQAVADKEQDAGARRRDTRTLLALPPPPPPPPPPAAKPMPQEMREELKSLGYLGHDAPEPVQPVEVESGVEARQARGISGGVVGGIVGGVAGGTPGGTVAGEPMPAAQAPAPLRVGGELQRKAEPGQPYADVKYKAVGTNPFTETAQDRLSTFGLDVDTGSYAVARRYIADGNLPDPRSVRVEEYVNYFNYGDPAPTRDDFAIRAEGAPTPFAPANHRLLRFNIRGREMTAEKRRPVVMTFVVDVSGSMDQENRLGLVKESLSLLLNQLTPRDRIGLVIYGDEARLILEPTNDREAARQAIKSLVPQGSTNAEAGLELGYQVAVRNFRMDSSNRILLCSDGVANVGRTGPQAILGRIGREARRGIELSTLGFGMGNYNDHLMEQLADKGDGRYAYIDTLDEAKRVLVEEVTGALQTIAKDAKAQVEFNPAAVTRYRLIGYENRAIADERFRDNTVDAGEIGAGHSVTALYEVELNPEAPRDALIATLRLRYRAPVLGNITETSRTLRVSQLAPSWGQASPSLRLAALVAEMAEIFKGTSEQRDLQKVARGLRIVAGEMGKNTKVQELAGMAETAVRIRGVVSGGEEPEEE
ncbi:MAG TPA: von Willebrand factor type A domain-containing protein [Thermoanaerobaculia bacterium]